VPDPARARELPARRSGAGTPAAAARPSPRPGPWAIRFTLAAALLFARILDLDLADVAALRGRVAELATLLPARGGATDPADHRTR
jgi:hypothetical protein